MIYKTAVRLCELQAMRLFAGDDESRFVLNGVLVESSADRVLLVATDGRRLSVLKSQCDYRYDLPDGAEPVLFVIPSTLLDRLERKRMAWEYNEEDDEEHEEPLERSHPLNTVHISFDTESKALSLTHGEAYTISGKAIDGDYPNWRKLIPATVSAIPAALKCLNADFIADFYSAFKILCNAAPYIAIVQHGEASESMPIEAAPVSIHNAGLPWFFGLLMGAKALHGSTFDHCPSWLSDEIKAKEVANAS